MLWRSTRSSCRGAAETIAASPLKAEFAENLRDEVRLQRRVTLPLLAAFLVELGIYYTDMLVIGRLGSLALGGVGLAGAILWEATYVGFSMLTVVSVIVAHGFGADRLSEVGAGVRTGLWLAVAISVPWMAFGWYLPDILLATGQDPEVVAVGRDYLHAMIWHLPATFLFMVLRQLVTGLSRPVVITVITAAAVPANLVLDIVLVFGYLGMPAMGVAGAGVATTIVSWLKLAVMVVYILRQPQFDAFGPFRDLFSFDGTMWRQVLRLGLPVASVRVIEGSMSQATTFFMGFFGASALAAHSVLTGVAMLSGSIAIGFGHGASVRVAQEFGGKRLKGAVRAGWFGISAVTLVVLPVSLALCIVPDAITAIVLDAGDPANAEAFALVREMRWVAAVFLLVQAGEVVLSRALRGFKDMMVPMAMSALGFLVIGIPAEWLLAFPLGGGPGALWAGMALGFAATAGLLLLRWRRFGRRQAGPRFDP